MGKGVGEAGGWREVGGGSYTSFVFHSVPFQLVKNHK